MRSDTQSSFCVWEAMSESPKCRRLEHRQHRVHRCLPPHNTHPTHLGLRDQQLRGSLQASFQLYLGTGLEVVCPVLPSFLSFSAKGHGRDSQPYLFAVSGIAQGLEGGRPHVVFMNS